MRRTQLRGYRRVDVVCLRAAKRPRAQAERDPAQAREVARLDVGPRPGDRPRALHSSADRHGPRCRARRRGAPARTGHSLRVVDEAGHAAVADRRSRSRPLGAAPCTWRRAEASHRGRRVQPRSTRRADAAMRCGPSCGARTCCANARRASPFAPHANGQTSAARRPAPRRPGVELRARTWRPARRGASMPPAGRGHVRARQSASRQPERRSREATCTSYTRTSRRRLRRARGPR